MAVQFLTGLNVNGNINVNTNQLQNVIIQPLATDPAGIDGRIYYNSGTNKLKIYNGTDWVAFQTGTDGDTTYDLAGVGSSNGTAGLALTGSDATTDTVLIIGAGTSLVTRSVNTITVTSNDQFEGTVKSVTSSNSTFISTVVSGTAVDPILTASLSATGTPGSTNFLRGDNTWAVVDSSLTLTGDVTGSGTNTVATTISAGAVDFAMINPAVIITQSEGIGNNNNDVTLPTTAAVKDYVDSSIVGQLVYQGGYNAATNTPNLDLPPTGTINQGFTYTVTVDGTFFTEQVRVGDLLIANGNTPTTLSDWTTVQNNIDLANATTVGIGNVLAGEAIDVSYSSGSATVSVEDSSASNKGAVIVTGGSGIDVAYASGTATVSLGAQNSLTFTNTGPATIGTSYTITSATHGLGTNSSIIMVQLVEVSTGETVYTNITRGASGLITITFADSQAINTYRALLQKIG